VTWAEFKKKWGKFSGKESAAYQEHFNDLCVLLGQPTPAAADPTGNKSFCFQKLVLKDAELFAPDNDAGERGFADVWKAGHFAWEYKGKKKNLDEAYRQLLRYRESLQNPPLLVVCDFDRFIIRTNFNGTVQEVYEFPTSQIDLPQNLGVLRALFTEPDFLKPQRTTAEVTIKLADKIASVAKSLQDREGVELGDARTRREITVAKGKNLRIARFLNRLTFCFFAEDTNLLPKGIMTEIIKAGMDDITFFSERLEDLFRAMAKGGAFGTHKIRHFNGHLFEDSSVYELLPEELTILADAAEADWQFIEPSIFGTLFERGLDPAQRSQLGAHYTSREDIVTLVEPVLMQPFRRTWAEIRKEQSLFVAKGKGTTAHRTRLADFLKMLDEVIVLDPACGSGNFLYVSLQLLLALEKEVLAHATQLGFKFDPHVSVEQLLAIEINPYAFELAQVSVQIGYLQWRRENGFDNDRTPVLQTLEGFQNEDALMEPHYHRKAKDLKEAQKEEHESDNSLKFYTERRWPQCDVIIGNPPYLGDKKMRRRLGDDYVEELRLTYKGRVSGQSDLCCYWFEKARELIERGKCKRAGLLATQAIRGSANRAVLQSIKQSGNIFFAISDREWILDGATVHVSLVGFDNDLEKVRVLDGTEVQEISNDLRGDSSSASAARELKENRDLAFIGTMKKGNFELPESRALELLLLPNPTGKPNSDVIHPWIIGKDITGRSLKRWLIDFPFEFSEQVAAGYEAPFKIIRESVYKKRVGHREGVQAKYWWRLARSCPDLREAIRGFTRYLVTPAVSKQRFFVWSNQSVIPDQQVITFARQEDWFAGILESNFHRIWLRRKGNQLREAESASRYNVKECFLTFPLPQLTNAHEVAISTAATELDTLRQTWLNPKEWTKTDVLEFPGTVGGTWDRYIAQTTIEDRGGFQIGTVRYPRIVPKNPECADKLKERTLTNLYNERPQWLAQAHDKLDAAVAAAYGWPPTLSEDDILARLLKLNLERAEEEAKATPLPSAIKTKSSRPQRAKDQDEIL
jgi:type II restriction/modification system DNA methylase subunit YeeA